MGIALNTSTKKGLKAQTPLNMHEAIAVLFELKHQSDTHLSDACEAFHDIAFEMEWRLREWQALIDKRVHITDDLAIADRPQTRFNIDSRLRAGKVPSEAAWLRRSRRLKQELNQLEKKIAEASAAIIMRNEEAAMLEQEITALQRRSQRLEKNLQGLYAPQPLSARHVHNDDEALAHFALEFSHIPDVADVSTLLEAARLVISKET